MSDCRDVNHKWWSEFDKRRMMVLPKWADNDEDLDAVEEKDWIPVKYELCETCRGKGTVVNPNIDRQGLSREDFDEDPDFAEDYFSGAYDIACNECNGERVALVVDEEKATKEQQQAIWDWYQEELNDRHTRMMESGGYY